MITQQLKSYTTINKIYFWTATIYRWLPLLDRPINKKVIVNSLKYLSDKHHLRLCFRNNAKQDSCYLVIK